MKYVNAAAAAHVVDPAVAAALTNSPKGKAFISLDCKDENGNEVTVNFSLNVLGMLGGMATGTADRFGYKW